MGIAAHHLGGPSLTLATVGGPPLPQIDRELAELGVPRRWIVTEAATRVCTTILDRATGEMTELVENGRPLDAGRLLQINLRKALGWQKEEAVRSWSNSYSFSRSRYPIGSMFLLPKIQPQQPVEQDVTIDRKNRRTLKVVWQGPLPREPSFSLVVDCAPPAPRP